MNKINHGSMYESEMMMNTRKKQGKRLSEVERNEIINLKKNSQLSDMKIAVKYNVDRSTITKIMNKVKKETMIEKSSSQNVASLPKPPLVRPKSKEETLYAKKLKLIEDSLFDWQQSTLNGQVTITNDSLKKKALDIFNLLKEKTAASSSRQQLSNLNRDWCENDYDNFNVMNSCDESNLFIFCKIIADYRKDLLMIYSFDLL